MRLILIALLIAGCSKAAPTPDAGSAVDMSGTGLTQAQWSAAQTKPIAGTLGSLGHTFQP